MIKSIPRKVPVQLTATAIGLLLLVAAALKAYDLVKTPIQPSHWLENRWLQLTAVEMEILIGCWLLAQVHLVAALRTTPVLFIVFTGVTLYKAVSGAKSCGCFGQLNINPWYTFLLDLGVLMLLLVTKDSEQISKTYSRIRMKITATLVIVFCIYTGFVVWQTTLSAASDAEDLLPTAGTLVVLDPERWVGRKFPLLDQIDAGSARLDQGSWVIVMYHSDCTMCQKAIPKYIACAKSSMANSQQFALVEIPPYAKKPSNDDNFHGTLARLRESHEWFAQTPLALRIENGHVLRAREGESAVEPEVMFAR